MSGLTVFTLIIFMLQINFNPYLHSQKKIKLKGGGAIFLFQHKKLRNVSEFDSVLL